MFPTFFKHKMREVKSFLRIMKGKVTGNDQERQRGVDEALNAMNDERRVYENEKREAKKGVDSDVKVRNGGTPKADPRDKPIRESGQDISAI